MAPLWKASKPTKRIRHLFYPRQDHNGQKQFFLRRQEKKQGERLKKSRLPAERLAALLGGEDRLSCSCQARAEGRYQEGVDPTHKLLRQRESLISSRG